MKWIINKLEMQIIRVLIGSKKVGRIIKAIKKFTSPVLSLERSQTSFAERMASSQVCLEDSVKVSYVLYNTKIPYKVRKDKQQTKQLCITIQQ